MFALILVIIGIIMRVVPHPANFTPVAAIALFGGACLSKKQSLVVPLVLMAASDLVLGLHSTVAFTWGGFLVIALLGTWLRERITPLRVLSGSLASSLIFFVISNFGVWFMGWYPRTLEGVVACYVAALPFLRDFTMATLIYSSLFFGAQALAVASRDEHMRFLFIKK